jgi:membrane fusion protein (multidrug efflux system)
MTPPKKIHLLGIAVAVAAVASAFYVFNHQEADAAIQSTDDAYVRADFTVVAPQVAGRIMQVAVEDNQPVRAGDLLSVIDDRDLRVAADRARAQVMAADAAVQGMQAQIVRQQSARQQAAAMVAADDAGLELARINRQRFQNLANDGSGTQLAWQQAEAQLRISEATRDKDTAAVAAVDQQTRMLQAELLKGQANQQQARAELAAAELQLSYTRITAPIAGVVAQRAVRVGSYVGTGTPLLTIVPLDHVYIEAMYRETQLTNVRPGQSVRIDVDGFAGKTLSGRVESLGPASGVSFSQIAPHNATGNFTKIVQRLPVRIAIDSSQALAQHLRVGMSVRPYINTEVNAEKPSENTRSHS